MCPITSRYLEGCLCHMIYLSLERLRLSHELLLLGRLYVSRDLPVAGKVVSVT